MNGKDGDMEQTTLKRGLTLNHEIRETIMKGKKFTGGNIP